MRRLWRNQRKPSETRGQEVVSSMAIMEYGPDNPHPAGFKGLRVEVKKPGTKPFQKYLSFTGLSEPEKSALRAKAKAIHAKEAQDAAARREARRLYRASRCPISPVEGVSVGVSQRKNRSPEIYINVSGSGSGATKARSIWKKTIATSRFDYFWFEKHWREACRVLARHRGLKRTPTRWFQGQPSKQDVVKFIRAKAPGFEYVERREKNRTSICS